MPAQFRADQVTPGLGTPGVARHDLVPGEIITLTATSPAPGAGVSYAWEILDKRGSVAVLSATTGQTVTIGADSSIVPLCGFLVELVANDNGVITRTTRPLTVRSTNASLRPALFSETAPLAHTLAVNDPDLSTDNALYANRSGLGVSEQNAFSWAEWAWEIVQAIESSTGSSGPPSGVASGDLTGSYPGPVVAGLRGRSVSATAPTSGQALVWNGSTWLPTTLTPSGTVNGDLSGTLPNPTVDGIQGVPVAATAPNNGEVLTFSSGSGEWGPAAASGGGGGGGALVFHPGGTEAGNVYTSFANLYAAAGAMEGPIQVYVEDADAVAEIPAGTYDFSRWTITGTKLYSTGATTVLTVLTGVTITGNFKLSRIDVLLNSGATSPMASGDSTVNLHLELYDASFGGDPAGNPFIDATTMDFGPPARVDLRGTSYLGPNAIDSQNNGTGRVDMYDASSMGQTSLAGDNAFTVVLVDPTVVVFPDQSGFSGVLTLINPWQVMNGALSEQQTGTVELYVGAIYLEDTMRVLAESSAMLGGAAGAETGNLLIRRFTGGTLMGTFSNTGVLDDTPLGTGFSVSASDWYELYLTAGGVSETAIVRGLNLLVARTG